MSRAVNEMATARDRREASEILRRIVKALPDPTPTQVAFLLGQASGLDPASEPTGDARRGRSRAGQARGEARPGTDR
jgi:hypothetical protein